MQNEILKPVLDSDEAAVPRYNIVGPDGKVIQQNVELRLQNEIVQEGTPYDEASVLPPELRDQLGLPQSATPAEAFSAVLTKAGGAVRRNRPPTNADAESVGKIWVIPEMAFRNMMPNAITQSTGSWSPSATNVSVASNTVTAVGNGGAATTQISATMNAGVKAGDIVFTQLHVTVNHDANMVVAELVLGSQVLATKTLNVPAAGATMLLQARTAAESAGTPMLRIYATYNTAAVQSGKGFTVKDITVWNLTGDMCEAQEGNEFTQSEAINYISTFGQFQTREYEYSTWWWVLRGVDAGQYFWHRMYDYATQAEAQGGTVDTKLMTPLRTQDFFTSRLATQAEAEASTDHTKAMTPLRVKNFLTKNTASQTEVNTGTDSVKVVTPATAAGLFTNKLASTTEAQAGTADNKWMSPLKVQQFLTSKLATQAEALAGTNNTKVMTPLRAAELINSRRAIGDVCYSMQKPSVGTWLECDGSVLNGSTYPTLYDRVPLRFQGDYTSLEIQGSTLYESGRGPSQLADSRVIVHDKYLYWVTYYGNESPYTVTLHRKDLISGAENTYTMLTANSTNYVTGCNISICNDRMFATVYTYYSSSNSYCNAYTATLSSLGTWTRINFGESGWSATTTGYTFSTSDIWYYNGYYCAMTTSSSKRWIAYSTNGTSWTKMTNSPFSNSYSVYAVYIHNSKVWALRNYSNSSNDPQVYWYYSSAVSAAATWSNYYGTVGYSNGYLVSVRIRNGVLYVLKYYYSDGVYRFGVGTLPLEPSTNSAVYPVSSIEAPFDLSNKEQTILNRTDLTGPFYIAWRAHYTGGFVSLLYPEEGTRIDASNVSDVPTGYNVAYSGPVAQGTIPPVATTISYSMNNAKEMVYTAYKQKTLPRLSTPSCPAYIFAKE